jgi:hypothetical protein
MVHCAETDFEEGGGSGKQNRYIEAEPGAIFGQVLQKQYARDDAEERRPAEAKSIALAPGRRNA